MSASIQNHPAVSEIAEGKTDYLHWSITPSISNLLTPSAALRQAVADPIEIESDFDSARIAAAQALWTSASEPDAIVKTA